MKSSFKKNPIVNASRCSEKKSIPFVSFTIIKRWAVSTALNDGNPWFQLIPKASLPGVTLKRTFSMLKEKDWKPNLAIVIPLCR